jgi:hypothetical protein
MKKYDLYLTFALITKSEIITPDGFSEIEFENIGTCACTIEKVIPLNPSDTKRKFSSMPYVEFKQRLNIEFSGSSVDKQVLVTKYYYTPKK